MQLEEPLGVYHPIGQVVHEGAPTPVAYLPPGQLLQSFDESKSVAADELVPSCDFPVGQFLQLVNVVWSAYFPLEHIMQFC